MKRSLRLASAGLLLASTLPLTAHAESSSNAGTGTVSTTARVDFQVTIPRFVSLRIGSNSSIDQITFAPTGAQIAAGTAVGGGGGDLGSGKVTVRIVGNGGDISLAAASTTALSDGTTTIPWTEISVANDNGAPAHPTVGSGSVPLTASAAGVVVVSGDWTYTFLNSAVLPSGTYNGRITYTASLP